MIAAGRLDRRITILRPVETGRDALNAPTFEYQPLRSVWAARVAKSEDEAFAANQRYAVTIATFLTHWMDDIFETFKLVCEGVEYDIKGVREIGRREGLEIKAEAHS